MSQSPMSITQLCNTEQQQEQQTGHNNKLDPHDPEVKLAAEALDSLASGPVGKIPPIVLPPISTMSTPSSAPNTPSLITPGGSITSARQSFSSDSTFEDDSRHTYDSYSTSAALPPPPQQQQQHFIRRVSNLPFVHSALRAYESSKASSPVVKYGAEMVESIASPIYGKFGRQSTLETISHNKEIHYPNDDDPTTAATTALANTSISDRKYQEPTHRRGKSRDESSIGHKKMSSRSTSRSTSPHRPNTLSAKSPTVIHHHRPSTAVSRSRWKQLMVHAGSAAGTTAAIISEESMKCLKYCLSWLQYATQHIDQQMNLLRNVLVSMATGSSTTTNSTSSTSTTVSTNTNPTGALAAIKKEVIETLRKVVEVISKYAGAGLPEQAKASVRSFILALPSRWALLNSSTTQSPCTSPALGPHTPPQLEETSVKLLNFGSESVEMLQSVSSVFSDTVDRADLWLDRLHSVGVTRRSTTVQRKMDNGGDALMDNGTERQQLNVNDPTCLPALTEHMETN